MKLSKKTLAHIDSYFVFQKRLEEIMEDLNLIRVKMYTDFDPELLKASNFLQEEREQIRYELVNLQMLIFKTVIEDVQDAR